jgi:type I restriction enzyme, S subunit
MSLPRGWARVCLGDVCERVDKWDPRKSPRTEFDYVDIGAIDRQRITRSTRLLGGDAPSRARQLVRSGDTILSTVRTYLVNTALVSTELDGATVSTGFCVLRPTTAIDPKFLFYRVIESAFVAELSEAQTGSSYPAVRDADVFALRVGLPPVAEQRRIVAAIEEQLSRVEGARSELSSLRLRLVAGRRSAISAAMREPDWPRTKIGDIGDGSRNALAIGPFGSNLKVSDYRQEGVPLVFVRNIRARQFGGSQTRFVSAEKAEELASHRVRHGDVLITKMGDPPGDSTVYPEGQPDAIITADCIKVSVGADFDPHFVALAIEGPEAHHQVRSYTQGVAQRKVSLGRFKKVLIPAPPLEVQRRVVARFDNFFNSLRALELTAHDTERKSAALRSAILGSAFRGQLVPQDPGDEPASVLLARIAAEHTATPKPARQRRDRTRA